ncbi:MAG: outer membrane protein assembly factor BamD [Deferribacteres bacterium]|nr:outer membrane protein assembly factor BamD [candidate division KSB1 bacterium]MCB9501478.1 outer membrane protein assembly factor BamD [Deferribacteres bacterium]
MKYRFIKITVLLVVMLAINACGGSKDLKKMTVRQRLDYARKLYDDGKYFEAKNQFQILILNNPGSRIIDEAQFYYADSFFELKEYLTAAAEYERLINRYPNSEYLDDASYKLGFAYFKMSPKPQLDQKYTYQAIDQFQQFMDEFPDSDLVKDVTKKLQECRTKLAQKEFETGVLYRKTNHFTAAIISFDDVLKRFYDTKYAEPSLYWKAYSHYEIGEPTKARDAVNILLKKYPDSDLKDRATDLAAKIDNDLERISN